MLMTHDTHRKSELRYCRYHQQSMTTSLSSYHNSRRYYAMAYTLQLFMRAYYAIDTRRSRVYVNKCYMTSPTPYVVFVFRCLHTLSAHAYWRHKEARYDSAARCAQRARYLLICHIIFRRQRHADCFSAAITRYAAYAAMMRASVMVGIVA